MDDMIFDYNRMKEDFLNKYARREVGMRHFVQHLKEELYEAIYNKDDSSEYEKINMIELIRNMDSEELEKYYLNNIMY